MPDRICLNGRWYMAEDSIRLSDPEARPDPYELLKALCEEYGIDPHKAYRAVRAKELDARMPHGVTRGLRCRRSEFVRWIEEDLMESAERRA